MRYLLIWVLVVLMGCQAVVFARAFDKQQLMALDPLCSQRLTHQSAAFQNNRLWTNVGLGGALLSVIWNNSGGLSDDAKLGNLILGINMITTAGIIYYTSGDPVVQNDTLLKLDLKGIEKEEVAYSILKYNVARSKAARENSGMILMANGLGSAWLAYLSTNASQSYKDAVYISAAIFFIQGLQAYLNPGQNEKDMVKIDSQVGAD